VPLYPLPHVDIYPPTVSPTLVGCVGRVYSLTVVFALLLLKEKVSDSDFETDSSSYSTGASRPAKLTTIRTCTSLHKVVLKYLNLDQVSTMGEVSILI